MLEEMTAFFKNRLEGYDEHMLIEVDQAGEFYKFTASQLPAVGKQHILDLGCGTGLELEEYIRINPDAHITGIDLSREMLARLRAKFPNNDNINLICGSYFDVPLGENRFDAAVSVESLHHFTAERKLSLYSALHKALKPGGYFILTDYFAESEELEQKYFEDLTELKKEQGITDDRFYHYDTPLTVGHETNVLTAAGFSNVTVLRSWSATYCVKAFV